MNNFRAELKPSEQVEIGASDAAYFWEKANYSGMIGNI